jgi:hypothetical protein
MIFQVYSTYFAVTAPAILLGECNREPATEFTARFVDEEILFLSLVHHGKQYWGCHTQLLQIIIQKLIHFVIGICRKLEN